MSVSKLTETDHDLQTGLNQFHIRVLAAIFSLFVSSSFTHKCCRTVYLKCVKVHSI